MCITQFCNVYTSHFALCIGSFTDVNIFRARVGTGRDALKSIDIEFLRQNDFFSLRGSISCAQTSLSYLYCNVYIRTIKEFLFLILGK